MTIGTEAAEHVVDCDARPKVPVFWDLNRHLCGGKLILNSASVDLYFPDFPAEPDGGVMGGTLLGRIPRERRVNANVLDYLLGHPDAGPEEWKTPDEHGEMPCIVFLGTMYDSDPGSDGDAVETFRAGVWCGSEWTERVLFLGASWNGRICVAVTKA